MGDHEPARSLEGEAREARIRLLDDLHGRGVAVEELQRACEGERARLSFSVTA